ncbi:Isopentenyl-diphosphate delta-isomerase [Kocuria palustris PEL]|uniref:Isopentenyl-diphosphate delta-isomerase n=1 Tax=Kocuria palustris PEL TaxID=1236550 RepID=M2WD63_9MICC|nr:ABC-ATPase domain-containing protein [Kocuria palustris]EME36397.1 Isopentenyl-diphosphate delta-isomerase [Kocuria palustris PEL]
MRTLDDLRRELARMDGRGYPAYRELQGAWDLGPAVLHVDHVQSDPYAPPSKIRLVLDRAATAVPAELVRGHSQRVAAGDHLNRVFCAALQRVTPSGHDKSAGSLRMMTPGQQVLERTAVLVGPERLELRLEAALPAGGRRIRGRAATALLAEALPEAVERSLLPGALDVEALRKHVELVLDQLDLQSQLRERGLIAFVGEGSILPRASGDSDLPLRRGAQPLQCPETLRTSFELPSGRMVTGMGIPEGITVIVGGGYHGKSTLLRALERGIHPHIAGDGREWVLTRPDAVSIRAEDGRSVAGTDISPFIAGLPQGTDTSAFVTANASGSTSQAAGLVEALEARTPALLIDEDTSATNFMIRDVRMRALISADAEPITPFMDRIGPLRDQLGVSTVLVAGGSSAFFEAADHVIAMESFQPRDATAQVRRLIAEQPAALEEGDDELFPHGVDRVLPAGALGAPRRDGGSVRGRRERGSSGDGERPKPSRARGLHTIQWGHEDVDLSALAQLMEPGQTQAIALALDAAAGHLDGTTTAAAAIDRVLETIDRGGLDALSPRRGHPGDMARPRRAEILAALSRCRSLAERSS